MNNHADALAALADKLVTDWQQDGKMPPMAWHFREFAIDAMNRALASLKGEAVVPALEVFRIAGGDVECCPNPTAAEAMDCLRDLRQCYEESLTTPPPQQAVKCGRCDGTSDPICRRCEAEIYTATNPTPSPAPAPQVASYEDFVRLATDPNRKPSPQGGGECETCDGLGYVVRYHDPYKRGDVSSPEDAPCPDCATPPAQQPGEVGEDSWLLSAIADEYLTVEPFDMPTGQGDADVGWRVYQYQGRDKKLLAEVFHDDLRATLTAALAPKEKGNG